MKFQILKRLRFWNSEERSAWMDNFRGEKKLLVSQDLEVELFRSLAHNELPNHLEMKLLRLPSQIPHPAFPIYTPSHTFYFASFSAVVLSAGVGAFLGTSLTLVVSPEDKVLISITTEVAKTVWFMYGG